MRSAVGDESYPIINLTLSRTSKRAEKQLLEQKRLWQQLGASFGLQIQRASTFEI